MNVTVGKHSWRNKPSVPKIKLSCNSEITWWIQATSSPGQHACRARWLKKRSARVEPLPAGSVVQDCEWTRLCCGVGGQPCAAENASGLPTTWSRPAGLTRAVITSSPAIANTVQTPRPKQTERTFGSVWPKCKLLSYSLKLTSLAKCSVCLVIWNCGTNWEHFTPPHI